MKNYDASNCELILTNCKRKHFECVSETFLGKLHPRREASLYIGCFGYFHNL